MRRSLLLGLATLLFAAGSGFAEVRAWKEAGSDRSITGELIRVEEGKAWIRKRNSSVVKVPVEKFAEADRALIEAFSADAGGGAAAKSEFKWETDYPAALARARAENKPLLLDFTGSDWCGWCIRLKEEVFSQKAFKDYAAKNLVLVELDFPRRTELPAALKKQNDELAEKFGIRGFPTILLLDKSGEKVAQTGYREGGAEAYVKHLEDLLK